MLHLTSIVFLQDIMLKIKNWVVEEKKHVRFYHDWNDKEVKVFVYSFCLVCVCVFGVCVPFAAWSEFSEIPSTD